MRQEEMKCHVSDWNVEFADTVLQPKGIEALGWRGSTDIGHHLASTFRDNLEMFLDRSNYLHTQAAAKLISTTSRSEIWRSQKKFLLKSIHCLMRLDPDIVGISVQERQHRSADLISRTIKKIKPEAMVVFGGYNPTLLTPDYLRLGYCDAVVTGEGETALVDIAKRVEAGRRDLAGIHNVAFVDDKGRPKWNRLSVISDLEQLPFPDFHELPLQKYFSPTVTLPVLCTRGCWWGKCVFCSHHQSYCKPYRARPVHDVATEIRELNQKYNCRHIVFNDEALPAGYAIELSEKMDAYSDDVLWSAYFRFQDEMKASFPRTMYRAGCRVAMWGLESGSQRILEKMDKGIEVSVASRLLRMFYQADIMNIVFCFIGFPGETAEEALQTVHFLETHKTFITMTGCCSFGLHHGSRIADNPSQYNLRLLGRKPFYRDYAYQDFNNTIPKNKAKRIVRYLDGFGSFGVTNDLRSHLLLYARHGVTW